MSVDVLTLSKTEVTVRNSSGDVLFSTNDGQVFSPDNSNFTLKFPTQRTITHAIGLSPTLFSTLTLIKYNNGSYIQNISVMSDGVSRADYPNMSSYSIKALYDFNQNGDTTGVPRGEVNLGTI